MRRRTSNERYGIRRAKATGRPHPPCDEHGVYGYYPFIRLGARRICRGGGVRAHRRDRGASFTVQRHERRIADRRAEARRGGRGRARNHGRPYGERARVRGDWRGDPTVGPVMRRLKKAGMAWNKMSEEELEDAFARGGMQRFVLDVEHRRVSVKADRLGRATPLELDFGGIGKGFALDECAKILEGEQFEMTDYLLDAGTSTQLMRGGPWKIGVGGVWKGRTRLDTVLELRDGAVSGSGFELQGEHVVDVKRKRAARRWAQTWSRAQSAAVSDALSAAALSMDVAELERACKELKARVLVAHNQKKAMDLLRDPLRWID